MIVVVDEYRFVAGDHIVRVGKWPTTWPSVDGSVAFTCMFREQFAGRQGGDGYRDGNVSAQYPVTTATPSQHVNQAAVWHLLFVDASAEVGRFASFSVVA